MIHVVVGKPGTGKTYFLVVKALKYLSMGYDVYSNFHIDPTKYFGVENYYQGKESGKIGRLHFWETFHDFVSIKRGIVLIDECQIYFNSRMYMKLPIRLQYKLQQHRKHGIDIWGSVQNVKRIDTVIRELANSVWELHRIYKLMIARMYEIEEIDKVKRTVYDTRYLWLKPKVYTCFDTLFEISPDKIGNVKDISGTVENFSTPSKNSQLPVIQVDVVRQGGDSHGNGNMQGFVI